MEFASQHNAIKSIHAGRKSSGVDERISNSLPHNQAVKEEYAKNIDIYELGQYRDIDEYEKVVLPCIGAKPLIICSDNHDPRAFCPKEKLWIKSDLTFNGLKQIIFEPKERVRVCASKPDLKAEYYVIDSFQITHSDFQKDPIQFNDKLNCIIGGKSTGKSILLHNLARVIDNEQVREKCAPLETIRDKKRKPITLEIPLDTMKVNWLDKSENSNRKIIYIPQTYLNRLADAEESTTEIDEIIEGIVLESADSDNKKLELAMSTLQSGVSKTKSTSAKSLVDIVSLFNEISKSKQKLNELGSQSLIEAEIERLQSEKEHLSQALKLDDEDIKRYDMARSEVSAALRSIDLHVNDIQCIDSIDSIVTPIEFPPFLVDSIKEQLQSITKKTMCAANEIWVREKTTLRTTLSEQLSKLNDAFDSSNAIKEQLQALVEENKAIQILTEQMSQEVDKLNTVKDIESKIQQETEKLKQKIEDLAKSYVDLKCLYHDYANHVNQNATTISSDMAFCVQTPFRRDAFVEKWKTIYGTQYTESKEYIKRLETNPDIYTVEFLSNIIEQTLNRKLRTISGYSPETALKDILDDWYNVKYIVEMGNDLLENMSPGKKALVLLKLLIELADSKCPILIDQPEDDLDNRSIYDQLIPFLKRKKIDRQIIIVTHNANIVVGADAEEIIVANQHADSGKNHNDVKFAYRSGSIENDVPIKNSGIPTETFILDSTGIQQHICAILEGGKNAFEKRKAKYNIT